MVTIAALSDTHLSAKVPDAILNEIREADIVVHAGDFVEKGVYESLASAAKKLVAVQGNMDSDELKALLPKAAVFEAGGIKFGVVHQGKFVTDETNMRYLALEMGVGALIFGHLHRPLVHRSDVLLVCPGSPTKARMSDPAIAKIVAEGGKATVSLVELPATDPCDYIKFARSL